QILAFDIYGTLLDTGSISTAVAEQLMLSPEKALELSLLWRRLQLEYTFRLNSMGYFEPFDVVTYKSFLHAAVESGYDVSSTTAAAVCEAYQRLGAFPDAVQALTELRNSDTVDVLVFSNGTHALQMVNSALDAASLAPLVPNQYLVNSVQKYKPAFEVYHGLLRSLGKVDSPRDVWLISGNPFDISGARSVGMSAVWVNRAGKEWPDKL
ncbi:haloacid dehalogenase, partial [Vararia minispora EC-137]